MLVKTAAGGLARLRSRQRLSLRALAAEAGDGGGHVGLHLEGGAELAGWAEQAGGVEDVADRGGCAAEQQRAAGLVQAAAQGEQRAEGDAGEVAGVLEVDDDLGQP